MMQIAVFYLGDDKQAIATQACDSWCDCYRGLATRMRGCNDQAANHTRECSAETGTRQRYAQDLLETTPVPARRVGRLLVGESTVPWSLGAVGEGKNIGSVCIWPCFFYMYLQHVARRHLERQCQQHALLPVPSHLVSTQARNQTRSSQQSGRADA
jgi:hypothetical protein